MTAKAAIISLKAARNLMTACVVFTLLSGALLVVLLLAFDIDFRGALLFFCAWAIGVCPGLLVAYFQLASLNGGISRIWLLGRDR